MAPLPITCREPLTPDAAGCHSDPRTATMLLVILTLWLNAPQNLIAGTYGGIGALGDTLTDEYQFSAYGTSARNWVEQLAAERDLDFGTFTTRSRGEPRREGFEFNWARTAATALRDPSSHLDAGQAGLSGQVASGDVSLAFVGIGVNDLAIRYEAIDNGSLGDRELGLLIRSIAGRIESAVDSLLAAGDVRLVFGNIFNFGILPYIESRTTSEGRTRITDAVLQANREIQRIADARSIPVVDMHGLTNLARSTTVVIGGVAMDPQGASRDPRSFFLDEGLHVGTVVHGLYANAFLEASYRAYDWDVRPLSDQEILYTAQRASRVNIDYDRAAETYFDVSDYVLYVPEPSTLLLTIVGLAITIGHRPALARRR